MRLFHGSQTIVKRPSLEKARANNDYGKGFYCTQSAELAKEWACQKNCDGYANEYEIDLSAMSVLDLTASKWSVLHWLFVLVCNRTFNLSPLATRAKDFLKKNYFVEYEKFDVIKGLRADDSYFAFASNFLNNEISLAKLEKAMRLGDLGVQFALKSQKAFRAVSFVGASKAQKSLYYEKFKERDFAARSACAATKESADLNGVYLIDILRGKNENPYRELD